MNPSVASLVYACGIAGLFYLNRDSSVRTSKALWLPVIYIWVIASRPVSVWLGISPPAGTNVQLDGSPFDRALFLVLQIAALYVLVSRGHRILKFLNANWPILAYFSFCLVSVLWSEYPGVSLKRWIKATGDVAMILIVITDEQPVAALRRLFSRTGFILIPISVLLNKYYPSLSRGYDPWSGFQSLSGVTLNKNMLGAIVFVLSLGAVWRVLALLRSEETPSHRNRRLLAQSTLLLFSIYLLKTTNSNTSTACFVLGAGVLWATSLRFIRRQAGALHLLVLALLVTAGLTMALGGGAVLHGLGRDTTLTGRTGIWADVIPMVPNPLVGAGFESFWLSPRVNERLEKLMPGLPINEAHNGYIEAYLELGWVGVVLISIILIDGYRRSVKAFRREPALGGLFIAFILTAAVYSITEAGFRAVGVIWILLLLSVMEASIIAAGVNVGASQPLDASTDHSLESPARTALVLRPRRTNYNCRTLR
jgi:exopolysaccharide production protein ExoQ